MTIVVNGVAQADTRDLNELSQLALVACDASYKGRFAQSDESLKPFDDTPQYGNPPPPFGFEFQLVSTAWHE